MALTWKPTAKRFAFISDDVAVVSACQYEDYMWHHVAVAIDDQGVGQLLVDGKVQTLLNEDLSAFIGGQKFQTTLYPNKCPTGSADNCCSLKIASKCDAKYNDFEGLVDEVSVWNRTLSREEIADAMFKSPVHLPSTELVAPRSSQVDSSSGRVLWGRFNNACANVAQDGDVSILNLGTNSKYTYGGVPWLPPQVTLVPSEIPLDGGVNVTVQGVGFAKSPFSHCVLIHPDPMGYLNDFSSVGTLLVGSTSPAGRSKYESIPSSLVTYSPAQALGGSLSDVSTLGGKVPSYQAHATSQLVGFFEYMRCTVPKASSVAEGYRMTVSHDGGMTAANTRNTTAMEFSIEFDGSVVLLGSGIPSQGNLFTVSLWVYPKKNVITSTIIELGTPQNPFGLYFENGLLTVRDSPLGGQGVSYTPMSLDTWHYLQLVVGPVGISMNQLTAKLDGMSFHGPTAFRSSNPALTTIGAGFVGYIDELKIYDEQIDDLSKAFTRELQQDTLTTYYRFNHNLKQSKIGGKFANDITTSTPSFKYSSHFAPWEPSIVYSINGESTSNYDASPRVSVSGETLEVTGFNFASSKFLACQFGNATQSSGVVLDQYAQSDYACSVPSLSQIFIGEGSETRSDSREFTKYYYPSFTFDPSATTSSPVSAFASKVVCKTPESEPVEYTVSSFSVSNGISLTKTDIQVFGKSLKCDGSPLTFSSILGDGVTTYSVSFWTYVFGSSATQPQVVMSFEDGSNEMVFGSIMFDGQAFSYYDENILYAGSVQNVTIESSMWHFITLSVDADGEGRLYVDCEVSSTFTTTSRPQASSQFTLCSSIAKSDTLPYDGLIDELSIFKDSAPDLNACPMTDKSKALGSYSMNTAEIDGTVKLVDETQNGNDLSVGALSLSLVPSSSPWESPKALQWSPEDSVLHSDKTVVKVSGLNLAPSPFFRLRSKLANLPTLTMSEDKQFITSASIQVKGECYSKDISLDVTNNYKAGTSIAQSFTSEVGEVNLLDGLLVHYAMDGTEEDRDLILKSATKLPVTVSIPENAETTCVWLLLEDFIPSILTGGWKFVCHVEDGNQALIYLNGYLAQGLVSDSYKDLMVSFKQSGQAFGNHSGTIDDVWIYDRPLDSCEIEARYYTSDFALNLPLMDGYGNIKHNALISSTGEITIEAWLYAFEVEGLYLIATSDNDNVVSLSTVDGSLAFSIGSESCTCTEKSQGTCFHEYISDKAKISSKTWTHVAASYNGDAIAFYIDGLLRDTKSLDGPGKSISQMKPIIPVVKVVGNKTEEFKTFPGLIHSLAVFPKARGAQEINSDAVCPYKDSSSVMFFNESALFEGKLVNTTSRDSVDPQKMTLNLKSPIKSGSTVNFAATARSFCGKLAMAGGLQLSATLSIKATNTQIALVDSGDGNYHGVINTTGLECGDYKLSIAPSNLLDVPVTIAPGAAVASMSEVLVPQSVECFGVPRTVSLVAKDANGCPVTSGTDTFKIRINGPHREEITAQYTGADGIYSGIFTPRTADKYSVSGELLSGPEPGVIGTTESKAACIDVCNGFSREFSGFNSLLFNDGNQANLDLSSDQVTMEFWINAGISAGKDAFLLVKSDTSKDMASIKGYSVSLDKAYDILSVSLYTSLGEYRTYSSPSMSLQGKGWYHIAITYTGTEISLYGNGIKLGGKAFATSRPLHSNPYDHDLEVGQGFSGLMDEIKLWKVALSEEEILESMHCPPYNKLSKLAAYFHFNEEKATTTGNVYHASTAGTVVGINPTTPTSFASSTPVGTLNVGVGTNALSLKYSNITFLADEIESRSTETSFVIEARDKCGFHYTKKEDNLFSVTAIPLTEKKEDNQISSVDVSVEFPIFELGTPQEIPLATGGFICSGGNSFISNEYYGVVNAEKAGKVKVVADGISEKILTVVPGGPVSISIDNIYPMQSGLLGSVDFSVLDGGSNPILKEYAIDVSFITQASDTEAADIPTSIVFDGGKYRLFFTPPLPGLYATTIKMASTSILAYTLITVQPGGGKPVIAAGSANPGANKFEHSALIRGKDLVTFAGATRNDLAYSNSIWVLENYDLASSKGLLAYQKRFSISGKASVDSVVKITVNTFDDINAGKMTSSCSDLYFANAKDHSVKLDHYINPSPGCGANDTIIYVKVPGQMFADGSVTIDLFHGGDYEATQHPNKIFEFYSDFESAGAQTFDAGCSRQGMNYGVASENAFAGSSSLKVSGSGNYLQSSSPSVERFKLQAFLYDSGLPSEASHFLALNDLFVNSHCDSTLASELSSVAFGIHSSCHASRYCVFNENSWKSSSVVRYPHWVVLEAESDGVDLQISIDGVIVQKVPSFPLNKVLLSAGSIVDQSMTTFWDEISILEKPSAPLVVTEISNGTAYFSPHSQWKKVTANGSEPAERLGHTAVLLSNEIMAIFGGEKNTALYNDVWTFSFATSEWNAVAPIEPTCAGTGCTFLPAARYDHIAFMWQNEMYIHGGLSSSGVILDDMWSFNFTSREWKIQELSEGGLSLLGKRFGHSIAEKDGTFYIFGGYTSEGSTNDFFSLELGGKTVKKLNSTAAISPRFAHSSFTSRDSIYISGGNDENNNQMNGLWKYDVSNGAWSFSHIDNSVNCEHYAAPARGGFIIHGGSCGTNQRLNNMYHLPM